MQRSANPRHHRLGPYGCRLMDFGRRSFADAMLGMHALDAASKSVCDTLLAVASLFATTLPWRDSAKPSRSSQPGETAATLPK